MAYLLKENILFLIQKVFTQFFKRHSSKVVTKLVVFVCRKHFLTEVVPGFVLRYKASTRRLLTILAPWCNIHVLMQYRYYTRINIKMFPRSPHEIENQYITYYALYYYFDRHNSDNLYNTIKYQRPKYFIKFLSIFKQLKNFYIIFHFLC